MAPDFSGIKNEIDKTEKRFKGFQANLSGGLKLFGKLTGIALGAKALYDFGKAAIKTASDLEEIQNVTDTVFGSMAKDVNEFSKGLIISHGIGELSAKKYASYMGAMLKSSGLHGEVVKNMSKDLTLLTADMASFYNMETDEMFDKVMSGISGQTEPLKRLGINMNIANLQAYALSQGIKKKWQAMSQAEQVLLRYNYLMSVTGDAQGDFARNSWNWAHSTKILSEKWKEFMGIMGVFLKEVGVPLVRILIKIVDGLILMGKALGKMYTMITGKELTVEANSNIADSAIDAAEGEKDLANGIDKVGKAAKKALAPFDELNILQNNLGKGDKGNGLGGLFPNGSSQLNTTISTSKVDNGLDETKDKANKFYLWFTDKWNSLKQMLSIPIMVPAPIFASISNPIYQPNWGLTPPLVPIPVFNPIPNPIYNPNWNLKVPKVEKPIFVPIVNPIYNPNWNLVPPKVPVPVFPAINYTTYNTSLESIKKKAEDTKTTLEKVQTALNKKIEEESNKTSEKVKNGLSTAWGTIETNYNKHKSNMGVIATAISTVLVSNINQGLSKLGQNTNAVITTVQNNLQTWGKNLGSIAIETAKSFANNLSEGYKVTSQNFASFANTLGNNLKSLGSGMLSAAAETARGFVSNFAEGFRTTWDNFKNLMSSMGERISGWFSENKSLVLKTTIAAGVVVGAGALALAAPAAIPYIGAALGGLASIPALAKGGITNGPTMALIGDNPGGKEVVSPLDGLLDMIVDAMSVTNNGNGGDTTIIVKIGEDTITEKVVSNINRQSRISGKTIITV